MLAATDLACSRGERCLFGSVNFTLDGGDWLHVKGENGAGKTTLLRTLIGLAPPDTGAVRWQGTDTRECAEAFRRAFVYLGHASAVKDELTAAENLSIACRLAGSPSADVSAALRTLAVPWPATPTGGVS